MPLATGLEDWEYASEEEWAERKKRIWMTFAQGGLLAEIMGKVMDAKPPKPYAQVLEEQWRKAEAERARQIKAAAEAAIPVPARRKLPGTLAERRAAGAVPQVPLLGQPPAVAEVYQARPELQAPFPPLSALRELPYRISHLLMPETIRPVVEEYVAGPAMMQPTAAGWEAALPIAESIPWVRGMVGEAARAAEVRVPVLTAGARRLLTEEIGGLRIGQAVRDTKTGKLGEVTKTWSRGRFFGATVKLEDGSEVTGAAAGAKPRFEPVAGAVRGAPAAPETAEEIARFQAIRERMGFPVAEEARVAPAAARPVAEIEADLASLRSITPRPGLAQATRNRIAELEGELARARAGEGAQAPFTAVKPEEPSIPGAAVEEAAAPPPGGGKPPPAAPSEAVTPPPGHRPPPGGGIGPNDVPVEALRPEVERSVRQLTALEDDRNLLRRSLSDPPRIGRPTTRVGRIFSIPRSFFQPSLRTNPDVYDPFFAASTYAEAQDFMITKRFYTLRLALEEGFGSKAVTTGRISPALYKGPVPTMPGEQAMVGTLVDALEQPHLYNLSPKARRAAQVWDELMRTERQFSAETGIRIGEWEQQWVGHYFRDPVAARQTIGRVGRAGRPPSTRARKLPTLREFAEVAGKIGLEVETDPLVIAARRLQGTAALRTERRFIQDVASRLGKRIQSGKSAPPGYAFYDPTRFPGLVFPRDTMREIQRLFLGPGTEASDVAIGQAVDLGRSILLNLDASGVGKLQGFLYFSQDPLGYLRTLGQAAGTMMTREGMALHMLENAAEYAAMSERGLSMRGLSTIDLPQATLFGRKTLIEKVPGLAQINELQFGRFIPFGKANLAMTNYRVLQSIRDGKGFLPRLTENLPVVRTALKKLAGVEGKTNAELLAAATDATDNWLGGINWARLGTRPTVLRRLLFLTEGWLRAQSGAIINAFKIADPRGIIARRMLMRELMTGAALTTAVSLAWGRKMPNLTEPRAPDWFDIQTPWGAVSWLPHKPIIRTIVVGIAGSRDDPKDMQARLNALRRFGETRTGQIPGLMMDLAEGRDYLGRDIDNKARYFAEGLLPIIGQEILQLGREPVSISEMAQRAAVEFGGASARPTSPYQHLVQLVPGWEGMTPGQRAAEAEKNVEVAYWQKEQIRQGYEAGQEWAVTRQQVLQERDALQEQLLAALNKPGITQADIADGIADFLANQAAKSELRYAGVDFKADSPDRALLDAYYDITMPPFPTSQERQELYDRQDAFVAANPRVLDLIEQNHQAIFTDPTAKAIMAEIDAARQVRRQYYAMPAFIGLSADEGREVNAIIAEASAMVTYRLAPSRRAAIIQIYQQGRYPQKLILYALQAERLRNPQRRIFRMQHPELLWFEALPYGQLTTAEVA